MDLLEYIGILRKKMWWIIGITLFATLLIGVISIFYIAPVYETQTSFIVGRVPISGDDRLHYEDILMYGQLIKTYVEIAKSQPVINETIKRTGYDITPVQLLDSLSLSQNADTQLFQISIRDTDIERAVNIANTFSDVFVEQIRIFMNASDVNILNRAVVPTKPISPNTPLNMVAVFLISSMSTIGIFILHEHLDDTLKDEDDIGRYTSATVLSNVPFTRNVDMITLKDPYSAASEVYRALRTNIRFMFLKNQVKTIVVTSANTGDGKSTVLVNLGIAMAQAGFKTLIIDADLRKPSIHKQFSLFSTVGLTNIIAENVAANECILETGVDNLFLLSGGPKPPNPSELLSTNLVETLLNDLKDQYDYILIDTPPILAVTDATLLASVSDGTLLVFSSGQTRIKEGIKIKEMLTNVGANILGVVNNRLKKAKSSNYYQYNSHT